MSAYAGSLRNIIRPMPKGAVAEIKSIHYQRWSSLTEPAQGAAELAASVQVLIGEADDDDLADSFDLIVCSAGKASPSTFSQTRRESVRLHQRATSNSARSMHPSN